MMLHRDNPIPLHTALSKSNSKATNADRSNKRSVLNMASTKMHDRTSDCIVSVNETAYVVTPNGRRLDARVGSAANVVTLDLVDGFGVASKHPRLRLGLIIDRDSTLEVVQAGLSTAWPELMAELRRTSRRDQ